MVQVVFQSIEPHMPEHRQFIHNLLCFGYGLCVQLEAMELSGFDPMQISAFSSTLRR